MSFSGKERIKSKRKGEGEQQRHTCTIGTTCESN
jgi:hypothetical protein